MTGRAIFVQRLRSFLNKFASNFKYFVIFVPNHHKRIIFEAGEGILPQDTTFVVPYNLYKLPQLRSVIDTIVQELLIKYY